MLMHFETKDCIYFCIDSSADGRIFSKTLLGRGMARGRGAQLPGSGEAGSHKSSLSHQCLCSPGSIETKPLNGPLWINPTSLSFMPLHTKMVMSVLAFLSWSTTEREKKKKEEKGKVSPLTISLHIFIRNPLLNVIWSFILSSEMRNCKEFLFVIEEELQRNIKICLWQSVENKLKDLKVRWRRKRKLFLRFRAVNVS